MNLDIGRILEGWDFQPGQLSVRKIRGNDGRDKIQMRLDLGLLQLETRGRPDGYRYRGRESALSYWQEQLRRYRDREGSAEGFTVDAEACEELRHEGVMYYHRYLAAFVLEDYELVEHDTRRNLRLMDFLNAYAEEEEDRRQLDLYRPYVLMMFTRARARLALADDDAQMALRIVRRGIQRVRRSCEQLEEDDGEEGVNELEILESLAEEIRSRKPRDPLNNLRSALSSAIEEERYEDAAELRDRIRSLQNR